MRMNALYNCKNPFQGTEKKVLTICSAGLLRSPTLAWFLGNHNYNTRSCGMHDYALIQIEDILLEWADIIICVHEDIAKLLDLSNFTDKELIVFNIPDEFSFKEKTLLEMIKKECIKHGLITND